MGAAAIEEIRGGATHWVSFAVEAGVLISDIAEAWGRAIVDEKRSSVAVGLDDGADISEDPAVATGGKVGAAPTVASTTAKRICKDQFRLP